MKKTQKCDVSESMKEAGFVYRMPDVKNMSDVERNKYLLAKELSSKPVILMDFSDYRQNDE